MTGYISQSLPALPPQLELGWRQFDLPTWVDDAAEYDETKKVPLYLGWDGAVFRAVLGDTPDTDAPDVYIERLPDRWLILIHVDGGDPIMGINILDDGSPVVVEDCGGLELLKLERPNQP